MKRIGIYPGTFDPVHPGHIAFALRAKELCQLDQIIFLPETSPRGKQQVSSLMLRCTLLRTAFAEQKQLSLYVPRSSPFSTAETLPELKKEFDNPSFTLLLGSDVFTNVPSWPDISTLLTEVNLAVGLRHTDTIDDMAIIARSLSAVVTFVELPDTAHLSSRSARPR